MRYLCVAVLLAWAIGAADVLVADEQQPAVGGQPRADVPEEFRFLFLSAEQRTREAAERGTAYWAGLWMGLPYDSISLERGSTGGCLYVCGSNKLTLYRRTTTSGSVSIFGDLLGRAELRTVSLDITLQPPGARRSEFGGSVDLFTYANLSYLLHKVRFLELPDRYESERAKQDTSFVTLTVVANGKTKAVTDFNEGRPVELWAIQQACDSVSKTIQWTQK